MERAKGFEPSKENPQVAETQQTPKALKSAHTQQCAQSQDDDWRNLAQIVSAWPDLPPALKAAMLAIASTATKEGGL
jgi:hypothetical protein